MSNNYSGKRRKKVFDPDSKEPFVLSRSKLDMFVECPRCSYLDLRLGVSRVQGPAFTLNNAVDALFKREFDVYRARSTPHPMMEAHDIDAVPFKHEQLEEWPAGMIASHDDPSGCYALDGTYLGSTRPRCEDAPCCGCCP